jgi:hypothetical protein
MTARHALLAMLALAPTACKDFFQVDSPVRVPAGQLDDPALAPVLVQGAIADFECAFSDYVVLSGLIGDEFYSSTFNNRLANNWDRRLRGGAQSDVEGCPVSRPVAALGLWLPLSTARYQADDAFNRLSRWSDTEVPNRGSLLATAAAYAGYTYALIGEGYCEAAFDLGPRLTPAQVLGLAEERFDTAIAMATRASDDDILNLALVGRARVRLDLGRAAEADADALRVAPGFVRYATYSSETPRRENQVFWINQRVHAVTVDPRYRNLTVDGVPDRRVDVMDAGQVGEDGIVPLWLQLKYPSESSPIPIASWEEAQLIVAEAEGGQSAVDRINALRANAGLPSFNSTDPVAIMQVVREERRRQLFLDGHRLNDMLRFNLPFDSGTNLKGQSYSSMTCIPLPLIEACNNPNIGC